MNIPTRIRCKLAVLSILCLVFVPNCFADIGKVKDKQIYKTSLGADADEVIIGDKASVDFKQQVTFTKWKNKNGIPENSLTIKAPDGLIAANTPTLTNGKVEVKDTKTGFYFNSDPDNTDNFKFGLILYEKPTTNTWSFQLEDWEEFDFWYQRPYLNFNNEDGSSWEIIDGERHERLPAMSGAWAVCHRTKKNYIVGQANYKIGTFGIFQRPKFIDANGAWVWADLFIENGVYTVTVPQSFLDNAVYPVKANDTFGSTDITSFLNSSRLRGTRYSPSSSGTVTAISVYTNNSSGTHQVAMYSDDAVNTTPEALLTSSPSSLNNLATSWVEHDVADYAVVSGAPYWLCRWPNVSANVYYLSTGGTSGNKTGDTFPTWPNPFADAWSAAEAYQYAIYATYTVSGARRIIVIQ